MSKKNIYEYHWKNGEKEWVLASGMDESKEFYINYGPYTNLTNCKVKEVPEDQWESHLLLSGKRRPKTFLIKNGSWL